MADETNPARDKHRRDGRETAAATVPPAGSSVLPNSLLGLVRLLARQAAFEALRDCGAAPVKTASPFRPDTPRSLGGYARHDNRGLEMTVHLSVFDDEGLREYFSVTTALFYTLMYSRFYTRIIPRHHESP